jgi:hypothetical protein
VSRRPTPMGGRSGTHRDSRICKANDGLAPADGLWGLAETLPAHRPHTQARCRDNCCKSSILSAGRVPYEAFILPDGEIADGVRPLLVDLDFSRFDEAPAQ